MEIDRKRAEAAFQSYVEAYDVRDEKVRLKIEHTYRVSALCDEIAKSLGLSEEDVDLAWLIGLLHDIGRFEQLKNYGTFIDDLSINHAEYGAEILFFQGKIRDYIEDASEDETIFAAVNCHNAYRIPDKLGARTEMFCHIIRDADKIDILKVNVDFPLEEIYNVSSEELRSGQVTEEVLECFEGERAVYRKLKKTAVDNVVGHISLVYELVYPVSLELVEKQGYLEKLMNFGSDNPVTERQFERIRAKMRAYIEGKNEERADTVLK